MPMNMQQWINMLMIGGDQKMVLTANNFLSVTSSVGASADVIVSVLEIS